MYLKTQKTFLLAFALLVLSFKTDTNTRLIQTAVRYLGRPYVAHVLNENGANEQLTIDTLRLDCWTFTEYCLASGMSDQMDFGTAVQNLRYRNGKVDGYGSRLHYFSEWAMQAAENGYLTDLTANLGGKRTQRNVNYITAHKSSYPLCASGKILDSILASELAITAAKRYVIPKNAVAGITSKLKDGDIIGIATNVEGLDFSHQGIVIKKKGKVHLVHASSEMKKVVQTPETLSAYLNKHKKHTGIVVLRPK
jgi:Protein of unknown function (DUF1460)